MSVVVIDRESKRETVLTTDDPQVYKLLAEGRSTPITVMAESKYETLRALCGSAHEFFDKVVMEGRNVSKFVNGEPLRLTGFDVVLTPFSLDQDALVAMVVYGLKPRVITPTAKSKINVLLNAIRRDGRALLSVGSDLVAGRMQYFHETFPNHKFVFRYSQEEAAALRTAGVIVVYASPNLADHSRQIRPPRDGFRL